MIKKELLDIKNHQKFAKIGMSVSLATLCITALNLKNKKSKNLHLLSGIALVGFSLYHANLYSGKVPIALNEAKKKYTKKEKEKV